MLAEIDPYNPTGSTAFVNFTTSRQTLWLTDPRRSHINKLVYDSGWEAEFCRVAEAHPRVRSYVKNHNLGFIVPSHLMGRKHDYLPDFILRVDDGHAAAGGGEDLLNLIVETKGYYWTNASWGVSSFSATFAYMEDGEFQKTSNLADVMRMLGGKSSLSLATVAISITASSKTEGNQQVPDTTSFGWSFKWHNAFGIDVKAEDGQANLANPLREGDADISKTQNAELNSPVRNFVLDLAFHGRAVLSTCRLISGCTHHIYSVTCPLWVPRS